MPALRPTLIVGLGHTGKTFFLNMRDNHPGKGFDVPLVRTILIDENNMEKGEGPFDIVDGSSISDIYRKLVEATTIETGGTISEDKEKKKAETGRNNYTLSDRKPMTEVTDTQASKSKVPKNLAFEDTKIAENEEEPFENLNALGLTGECHETEKKKSCDSESNESSRSLSVKSSESRHTINQRFRDNASKLEALIIDNLQKVANVSNIIETINMGYEVAHSDLTPAIYIIASLGDKITRYIIIDICYLLKYKQIKQNNIRPNIYLVLLLPSISEKSKQAEAFLALKEMEHFIKSRNYKAKYAEGHEIQIEEEPMDLCIILETTNETGARVNEEQQLEMLAELTCAMIFDGITAAIERKVLEQASIGEMRRKGNIYASCGLMMVYMPLGKLIGLMALRKSEEAVSRLLLDKDDGSGINDAAKTYIDGAGLTSMMLIRELRQLIEMKDDSSRFLRTMGTRELKRTEMIGEIEKAKEKVCNNINYLNDHEIMSEFMEILKKKREEIRKAIEEIANDLQRGLRYARQFIPELCKELEKQGLEASNNCRALIEKDAKREKLIEEIAEKHKREISAFPPLKKTFLSSMIISVPVFLIALYFMAEALFDKNLLEFLEAFAKAIALFGLWTGIVLMLIIFFIVFITVNVILTVIRELRYKGRAESTMESFRAALINAYSDMLSARTTMMAVVIYKELIDLLEPCLCKRLQSEIEGHVGTDEVIKVIDENKIMGEKPLALVINNLIGKLEILKEKFKACYREAHREFRANESVFREIIPTEDRMEELYLEYGAKRIEHDLLEALNRYGNILSWEEYETETIYRFLRSGMEEGLGRMKDMCVEDEISYTNIGDYEKRLEIWQALCSPWWRIEQAKIADAELGKARLLVTKDKDKTKFACAEERNIEVISSGDAERITYICVNIGAPIDAFVKLEEFKKAYREYEKKEELLIYEESDKWPEIANIN